MIKTYKKQQLKFITWVYWFLLLYIIAALVWWFISLETQNNQMYVYRVTELKKDAFNYTTKLAEIEDMRRRKTAQYIGEGSIFLLFILAGAVFIFKATRKQFVLSQQQQNFMMAVTHELKTPIAVTRLNIETLQKRKLEEAQQQKIINNTLYEVNRLNELTNNILVASQLESGAYYLNKQELNLSDIAKESINDFIQRHADRKIEFLIDDAVFIEAEKMLIQLLINNLLDNAVKYSSKETPVIFQLKREKSMVKIIVADEGIGISDEEKKKVFDKFYRVGSESTRTTKGTGLGLYLCRKIVHEFKGSVTVHDNKPRGSIFTVTLKASHHE